MKLRWKYLLVALILAGGTALLLIISMIWQNNRPTVSVEPQQIATALERGITWLDGHEAEILADPNPTLLWTMMATDATVEGDPRLQRLISRFRAKWLQPGSPVYSWRPLFGLEGLPGDSEIGGSGGIMACGPTSTISLLAREHKFMSDAGDYYRVADGQPRHRRSFAWRPGRMNARARVITPLPFICLLALICGCASRPQSVPPATGPDFPNSGSFYPLKAQNLGQEGTTTVFYCVDANGHLVDAPSVRQSSGNDELDAAALELAKAGDGHYRPAYENGQPLTGCATFNVKFQIRIDPRFPILSRRANELTAEFELRMERMEAQLKRIERPPDLTAFVPGNQEQVTRLRQFADGTISVLKQNFDLLSEFIAKTDELGRADDVTEAERTAFSEVWQLKRAHMDQMREAALDMQDLVASVYELIDYVQNVQPPLSGSSGPVEPSSRQRTNIDLIISRARNAYSTS